MLILDHVAVRHAGADAGPDGDDGMDVVSGRLAGAYQLAGHRAARGTV